MIDLIQTRLMITNELKQRPQHIESQKLNTFEAKMRKSVCVLWTIELRGYKMVRAH